MLSPAILVVVAIAVIFITISAIVSRYKRCPSDKILVVYGRTGGVQPNVFTVVAPLFGPLFKTMRI